MRVFVERWHDLESNTPLDVWFDEDLARYEVIAGALVVFTGAHLVDVLFWCMGMPVPAKTNVEPIDL